MPYISVLPTHRFDKPENGGCPGKYWLMSNPCSTKEEAVKHGKTWSGLEATPENEVRVIELHIPENVYEQIKPKGTYLIKEDVDRMLAENERYSYKKVSAVASLLMLAGHSPGSKLGKLPVDAQANIASFFGVPNRDYEQRAAKQIEGMNEHRVQKKQASEGKDSKDVKDVKSDMKPAKKG